MNKKTVLAEKKLTRKFPNTGAVTQAMMLKQLKYKSLVQDVSD